MRRYSWIAPIAYRLTHLTRVPCLCCSMTATLSLNRQVVTEPACQAGEGDIEEFSRIARERRGYHVVSATRAPTHLAPGTRLPTLGVSQNAREMAAESLTTA